MEKQEMGLINQWWGPAPSLDVAGEQGVEEGPLARYPMLSRGPELPPRHAAAIALPPSLGASRRAGFPPLLVFKMQRIPKAKYK